MKNKQAKVRVRLPDQVKAAERQHAELVERLARLQTDTNQARAKHDLLSACLELLRSLYQQQQEDPDACCSHAVPVDELLQLEQLLELAPQSSPEPEAAASSSSSAAPDAAAPDAWQTIAPRDDPLALLREVFQRPPHPGVGPDTTLQQLQDGYSAFCGELALHMRVRDNPHASAEGSAARARAALLDWYQFLVELLLSPWAGLIAQVLAINCSTGEAATPDAADELYPLALQRMQLSAEQQERIALGYQVLSQLHSASLAEAMAAAGQGSLDEPASQLFGGSSALPVGLLQPAAGPGQSGSSVVREQHQQDLQSLRVKLRKAFFLDACSSSAVIGALTINQLCELALCLFPFPMRPILLARKVAAMQRNTQEQQPAAARQQQEAQGKKKGSQRTQTLHQQPGGSGDNAAKSSTDITARGSAG